MSDADIQKCIADKFAKAEKLKSQDFHVTVTDGVATLMGNAANAGSKGAATRIAKSCGAKSVTNKITAPPVRKPAKKAEKKEEEKKG
jgi:osmotically-inducible protein OsmY